MREDVTDITLLLDRTGSMQVVRDETITAVNRFLEEQKKVPGEAAFTLVQFDSQDPFEVVQRAVPIREAKPLTAETYVPRAWTPLLDAIGRTINDAGARLGAMSETDRPGKVVLAIITDGLENASKEFSRAKILEMIKHQREAYSWQIVFLGANQDAIAEGAQIGLPKSASLTYATTPHGVQAAYASLSENLVSYRIGTAQAMNWSEEDRNKQKTARQ
jgi:hypothetical protein